MGVGIHRWSIRDIIYIYIYIFDEVNYHPCDRTRGPSSTRSLESRGSTTAAVFFFSVALFAKTNAYFYERMRVSNF